MDGWMDGEREESGDKGVRTERRGTQGGREILVVSWWVVLVTQNWLVLF